MFLLNIGYQQGRLVGELREKLDGVIVLPSGSNMNSVRSLDLGQLQRVLFDPQLYLASLKQEDCNACNRLVTFPWFWKDGNQDLGWAGQPPSGTAIKDACTECTKLQLDLKCSDVILPTPLITEREGEAATQAMWLDAGLEVAKECGVDKPLLATVALNDAVINADALSDGGFLDTVVDQVSARKELTGVYIVIAQRRKAHPFDSEDKVQEAYLRLSTSFQEARQMSVVINFADLFGIVCLAQGATHFAAGRSHSLRRMSLDAFLTTGKGGGRALPRLYCHQQAAEFLSETHLTKIAEKGLLRRVRDETPYSENLWAALDEGKTASSVVPWAEGQNNTAAAQKHFLFRMATVGRKVSGLPTLKKKHLHVTEWLQDVEASQDYLAKKVGREVLRYAAPAGEWLALLEKSAPENGPRLP